MISSKISKRSINLGIILIFALVQFACNPTKYLKEDEYLLRKVNITSSNKNLDVGGMSKFLKQHSNKKILGVALYARIYNLVDPDKEAIRQAKRAKKLEIKNKKRRQNNKKEKKGGNSFTQWLQNIGESPIIYDQFKATQSKKKLELHLKNSGYYHAKVNFTDTLLLAKKYAKVEYVIESGAVCLIDSVQYHFEDVELERDVMPEMANSLVTKGKPLDVTILQDERTRITKILRDNGYYAFSKEYIYYRIDTIGLVNKAIVTIGFKLAMQNLDNVISYENHHKYYYNNIYIYSNHAPKRALESKTKYFGLMDTLNTNDLNIVYENEPYIKPKVLLRGLKIFKDSIFNTKPINSSYDFYSALRNYKLINFQFEQSSEKISTKEKDTLKSRLLDCHIYLTPATRQSYSVELEGSNTSGFFGMAVGFNYQNKNLFRGGEIFSVGTKIALENKVGIASTEGKYFNSEEYIVDMELQVPHFLVPIKAEKFNRKYNPKTTFYAAYNFQRISDYTRALINTSFGYTWHSSKFLSHYFKPFDLYATKLWEYDSTFVDYINKYNLSETYMDHIIAGGNYTITFNNQSISTKNSFIYARLGLELAGNSISLVQDLIGKEKQNIVSIDGSVFKSVTFFDVPYFQYFKVDFDFRYHHTFNKNSSLVSRFFVGFGYPYGEIEAMPFEKQYYSGGASSIRAWEPRSVGPGAFNFYKEYNGINLSEMLPSAYASQMSDIKLEINIEQRFKLFWMIHGAIFVDMGNIWSTQEGWKYLDGYFEMSEFYKDLAIGSGFGLRFDLGFFVFRLDLGVKVIDPRLPRGNRFVWNNSDYNFDKWHLNFGIGYPF